MTPLPPLPVAIPFLVAAVLVSIGRMLNRRVVDSLAIATTATVMIICAVLTRRAAHSGLIVYWFGNWWPRDGIALGISFAVDAIGGGLATLVAVLVLASFIYSWQYFDSVGELFHVLMLVFLGSMAGFCLTGDLFNLFVFFELMSAAAYALTAYKIEEVEALEGAINFAIVNSIGAFLMLAGIGLLYGRTGALNMAQIGRVLATHPADGLVMIAFLLITCGFLVKAAAVPFHFWLADAHAVAPTPVCVLFSGVMVEVALYAVIRVWWVVFSGGVAAHSTGVGALFVAVGALTAVVGGIMCFGQRHLKRMLAFSTISHMGVLLVGLGLLSPGALAGVALYVLGHGAVKGALFMVAGIILHRHSTVDENELRGKGRRMLPAAFLFVLGGLGLAEVPPFATFMGRSLIEAAATSQGRQWLSILFFISAVLTGGAVLRAAGQVFVGWGTVHDKAAVTPVKEEKETRGPRGTPPVMLLATALLIMLGLALGLIPHLSEQLRAAAVGFQDRSGYARAVLDSAPPPVSPEPFGGPRPHPLTGIMSGLAAIALALIGLFYDRLPMRLLRSARFVWRPPLGWLRKVHSGKAGDYVTWLLVGVAGMGACLAVIMR